MPDTSKLRRIFKSRPTSRWQSPHSKATYPAGWQNQPPPEKGYNLLPLQPTLADQELRPGGRCTLIYWEGLVTVQGARHQEARNRSGVRGAHRVCRFSGRQVLRI
jgi:hypothetical protein